MLKQMQFLALIVIVSCLGFCTCKHSTNTKDDVEEGKPLFSTYKVDVEVVPNVIHRDSLITLTMTCYPAMTGVGYTWTGLGSSYTPVALEYPNIDTFRTPTNVMVRASFVTGVPYTQQWKFRMLERIPSGPWGFGARASFDSIYVADSLRMYWVYSEELREILGVLARNDVAGSADVTTVPTNP